MDRASFAQKKGVSKQLETTRQARERCECCRFFQKDAITGYCRSLHAYVLRSFWCIHFQAVSSSPDDLTTDVDS